MIKTKIEIILTTIRFFFLSLSLYGTLSSGSPFIANIFAVMNTLKKKEKGDTMP